MSFETTPFSWKSFHSTRWSIMYQGFSLSCSKERNLKFYFLWQNWLDALNNCFILTESNRSIKIWQTVFKRRLQTKYVPNILPLGPYIKELKRFEDSSSCQNSSFQEGPKFSSSVKCRYSHDWQFWPCKFLLSTDHSSETLITMHFGVGFDQSKREKIH